MRRHDSVEVNLPAVEVETSCIMSRAALKAVTVVVAVAVMTITATMTNRALAVHGHGTVVGVRMVAEVLAQ